MKYKAAFLWDSSAKSISYMIIDENCNYRLPPKSKKLNTSGFETEAESLINSFFESIKTLKNGKNDSSVEIEYKIVGHGSPVEIYRKRIKGPSENTNYVKEKFDDEFKQLEKQDGSIKLIKQCRSKLKKDSLKKFKNGLDSLTVVKKERGNAYQYHLWALALHATNGNYPQKLRKIQKALTKSAKTKSKTHPTTIKKQLSS